MNLRQIEAWALRVIDAVVQTQTMEDSRTELKSLWPADFAKTARQIAGHANAAGDDPVLWIIGVDEERGPVDFEPIEFSDWYNQLGKQFDPPAPRMTSLVVPYGDKRPVAVLIETDRAPFVVKNPAHNTPAGGPVQWETPWREETATRTARRADLLRLFLPMQRRPDVELVEATASCSAQEGAGDEVSTGLHWSIEMQLFFVPRGTTPLVIPFHHAGVTMTLEGYFWDYPLDTFALWSSSTGASMAESDSYQATLRGATMLMLRAEGYHPDQAAWHNFSDLNLTATMLALDLDVPIIESVELFRGDRGPVPLPGDLNGLRSYSAIYAHRG